MSQSQKLLIKQKDYQLQKIKTTVSTKISIHDPLINPPKRKGQKKKTTLNQFNPLNRVSRIPQKIVSQVGAAVQIQQEPIQKIQEGTPWATILKNFQKVFDLRKQTRQIKLINVFGSQGTRVQEELYPAEQQNPRQSLMPKRSQLKGAKEEKQNIKQIGIRTYLKILDGMKKQLRLKWNKQQKVGSLQITIQTCKLLHDTSHAKFHALKFAYCMDIIEEFGINVFNRIRKLSFPGLSQQRLSAITIKDLEAANIPDSAQEVCKNWINKISSIRQLIPRIFVQTTLLRLYFFIDNGVNARKVLKRLAKSNRCFGEYINCIFFCTFLIRIGRQCLPQDKDYILDILDDVFFYIKQGKTKFNRPDISYDEFFEILEPFFVSSFESLAESLTKQKFKRFCKILPQNPHPVILKNFINSFSPSLLVFYSVDIAVILQKVYKNDKYPIYRILLDKLAGVVWSQSGEFIVTVWTDISEIQQLQVMLDLLQPFSQIIFCNLPRYEKNRFYSLILQAFNKMFYNFRRIQKNVYNSFQNFLSGILQKTEDITDIITLQPFLQIVSYFPKKNKKQISENVAKTFLSRDQKKITDPVIVHIMLSLMKNMQGMPVKDLTLKFLNKVDFKDDFEQNLSFLNQMRAIFGYIPQLTVALIYKAANLTFIARRNAKGKINKKLISFLQASLAYCYITVPVLQDNELKLKMYLYLSQIALSNNLISQATSLIKTCITQLAQVQTKSDIKIYQIFYRIISFLIVMPDDPETDYLFLFNGLFQAFNIAKFKTNYENIVRFQFYTNCMVYLSAQAQQRLPFHIEGVVSNDGLFKNKEFQISLVERIHDIFQEMQKCIRNILTIQGVQLDHYTLTKMCGCILTLLTVFQKTIRSENLIISCIKVIEKCRGRLFKDLKNEKKYKGLLERVNSRLVKGELKGKIKI